MFGSKKRSTQTTDSTAGSSEAVKDPVCGMSINPGSALRHEHEGKTYFSAATIV
jgi:hypothetical protein